MNSGNKEGDAGNQQQQSSDSSNVKPELTAEWTVRAQLTISRPSGSANTTKQSEADDPHSGSNPVRVVYKWSSDDVKPEQEYIPPQQETESSSKGRHESFRSTTAGNKPRSDSGFSFSGSNLSRKQALSGGTRCKSTCSIVLSAVADFLPANADIPEEQEPVYYNTAASYTVSPEQATEDISASQNFGVGKILALRDAYSQTSDTEVRRFDSSTNLPSAAASQSGSEKKDGWKRKPYDYRRITDSMLAPPIDEGNSYLQPSYATVSPARTYTSSPGRPVGLPTSSAAGSAKSEPKKPPRTVHIDVYCTGSDAEDDDGDDEDDSSSRSSENRNELESNSTPQTVLDTEQMLLRHQRVGMSDLPRRFVTTQQQQQQLQASQAQTQLPLTSSDFPDIGHAVTKSSTAEEINESKQILFKKHMGDRNRYNFRNRCIRKDPSDDCISSNYPNSSRSTMRDMTCSSISSAVQSNIYEDVESSWKETEPDLTASLAKSDSFEYDNSIDRLRIRNMEQLWSRPEQSEYGEYKISPSDSPSKINPQGRIQDFLHSYRLPSGIMKHYFDTLHSEYDILSETEHSFVFDNATIPERDEPPEVPANRSLPPATSSSQYDIPRSYSISRTPERPTRSLLLMDYNKSGSEASTLQSNLSGYTSEYLAKARKFGAVVTALRKPGHHVGPAKNPDCGCEHCRRWLEERGEGRGRAFSVGDTPKTRGAFWLKRAGLN